MYNYVLHARMRSISKKEGGIPVIFYLETF